MDRMITMEEEEVVMGAALPQERRASRLRFDNILALVLFCFVLFCFVLTLLLLYSGRIIVICILLGEGMDAGGLHKTSWL
jgi:hypothetical protein